MKIDERHFIVDDPEQIWASILGRREEDILAAWAMLDSDERIAVYAHLKNMASEEGWAEPQRVSAQAALNVLARFGDEASSDSI